MYIIKIKNCDLDQIADSGQCFRWMKTGEYTYKIPVADRTVEVTQREEEFTFSCDESEFNEIWREYFDIDTDYEELIRAINPEDDFLRQAASYAGGIRILKQDLWEVMLSFLISQNNNIPRIKKNIEALCKNYEVQEDSISDRENGSGAKIGYDTRSCMIPDWRHIYDGGKENLLDLKLGYRAEYIYGVCKYLEEKPNFLEDLQKADQEKAMQLLLGLKGVGKKVASCICLFGLHQLGACPVDTWIQKIIDEDYHGTMPKWMTGRYAGIYQQYAFYYKREKDMRISSKYDKR